MDLLRAHSPTVSTNWGGRMKKIRLLLADDHPLVLQWLACLLFEGWTMTSIESARMHEKDNGVFF